MSQIPNFNVRVGSLSAQATAVDLPMGLRVSSVLIQGADVFFQKEPFLVETKVPGSFVASVTEGDLGTFLNRQAPAGLKNFRVQARDGKVFVEAVKPMLIDLPFKAVCKLRIVDQTQVWIDLESVDIMGAGATNVVQSQLEKVNPVLDVRELPFLATFETIMVEDGSVTITGVIEPKR